jgi:hypothetical protein
MSVDQLFGKYKRLKKDLSVAYSQPQWNAALVDRLVDEIGIVERELAQRAPLGMSHAHPGPLPQAGEGGTTASPPAR